MRNLDHLPADIQLDVITRLPTETILDCKSVCKPWRDLVSHHPSFCRMHLKRLNESADSDKLSFLFSDDNGHLYHLEYNESHDETPIHRIRKFNLTPPFENDYRIIGSVNGLVCLFGWRDYTTGYCICNPLTKEYVKLPSIARDSDDFPYIDWSSGFGYLPSTNEYKVVHVFRRQLEFTEVAVYTLGSGNGWRTVGTFDVESCYIVDDRGGVFVKGALHWVDTISICGGRVYVFDLTEEKFHEHISTPPLPDWSDLHGYCLAELGGVLSCRVGYYDDINECECSDLWLLKWKNDISYVKEQEAALGWNKLLSSLEGLPLAFTKSGGVLHLYMRSQFCIYDAKSSISKELVDFGAISQIKSHKNTLASLKEMGEEDTKMMESAEMEETKQLARVKISG